MMCESVSPALKQPRGHYGTPMEQRLNTLLKLKDLVLLHLGLGFNIYLRVKCT